MLSLSFHFYILSVDTFVFLLHLLHFELKEYSHFGIRKLTISMFNKKATYIHVCFESVLQYPHSRQITRSLKYRNIAVRS